MLVIRLQRTGRKGHAMFRVVVQDSRRTPTSGNVICYVGNYDPHQKSHKLDAEKIKFYLANGAQPSDRVIKLLDLDKIDLPKHIKRPDLTTKRTTRHPEKRRSTTPDQPVVEEVAEAEAKEEVVAES